MGEKLRHPLLIEAVCEFRFRADEEWDWAVPGMLYERIRDDFSERHQVQGMGVHFDQTGKEPVVAIQSPRPDRMQFRRPDGSALVQVGQHLLTINYLRAYSAWEDFLALILQVLGEYEDITGPTPVERIGLRYINQIEVQGDMPNVASYLTLVPPLTRSLDQPVRAFYQRYELQQTSPSGIIVHQTGTRPVEGNLPVLILDLDFVSDSVTHLDETHELEEWLDAAHTRIYEAFVDSLNPEFYQTLRMENP